MPFQIIDPRIYPDWDNLILTNSENSFFYSSGWARVLSESYGYTPLYFASVNNGLLSSLVPVMGINSILTGKRGVSLPFTDYCNPVVEGPNHYLELFNTIVKHGKNKGWRYLEFRGGKELLKATAPASSFFTHTLELTPDEGELLSRFRGSTRRNIKKAGKAGVEVNLFHSPESVDEFCRLNCMTRKDHGLPPQPYFFFKKIYEHVISRKNGFVVLASHKGKNIGGAIYFHMGGRAIYKYGASDKNFQHLRPNNLIMWEAIKWCARNGLKRFCFGRSETEHKGLLQFKRGWGVKEETIHYYKYDLGRDTFLKDALKSEFNGKFVHAVFKNLPVFVLNAVGRFAYRHVG